MALFFRAVWPRFRLPTPLFLHLHQPLTDYEIARGRAREASQLTDDQAKLLRHLSMMEKYG